MHDKIHLEKRLLNKNNYDYIFLFCLKKKRKKLEINIKKEILLKILKI